MVQDLPIRDEEFTGAHPPALSQVRGDDRVLIGKNARGRNIHHRQGQDQIRLAQLPLGRAEVDFGERIFAGSARSPGVDPMDQGLELLGRQALIGGEVAHGDVRLEGRHPVRAQHLTDHRREALDLRIGGQGHRPQAAGLVADHALVLEDRGDVAGIGNVRPPGGLRLQRIGDRFAAGRLGGRVHRFSGDQGVERAAGVGRADRPAKGDRPGPRIEHQHLGRARQPQTLSDQLLVVEHHGNAEIGGGLVCRHLRAGVAQTRIDCQEVHALSAVG